MREDLPNGLQVSGLPTPPNTPLGSKRKKPFVTPHGVCIESLGTFSISDPGDMPVRRTSAPGWKSREGMRRGLFQPCPREGLRMPSKGLGQLVRGHGQESWSSAADRRRGHCHVLRGSRSMTTCLACNVVIPANLVFTMLGVLWCSFSSTQAKAKVQRSGAGLMPSYPRWHSVNRMARLTKQATSSCEKTVIPHGLYWCSAKIPISALAQQGKRPRGPNACCGSM